MSVNEMMPGKRIIVLGCPGSGKSTLSGRLHELTGIPLIHLDSIWWRPDRTHISREEFDRRLEEILKTGSWIIDGDYSRTYGPRFEACDTVVFLDTGTGECLDGIRRRTGSSRNGIPWTEEEPDPELVKEVLAYRETKRPLVLSLIRDSAGKRIIMLGSREEADAWLLRLAEMLHERDRIEKTNAGQGEEGKERKR